jgi:hypothetical protein
VKELFITVSFPGMLETTYRFDEFPVRVGRSPSNHLTVRHEAIARELCTAWIEPDGKGVRVEERPNLVNPLLSGKSRVQGGISGESVSLSVGPCKITFFSNMAKPRTPSNRKRVTVLASLVVLALLILVIQGSGSSLSVSPSLAALPKTPFCFEVTEHCDTKAACVERARLLSTRAREMLVRPNVNRAERIRAAAMLSSSAELFSRAALHQADSIRREATSARLELTRAYQQDVMALRRALAKGEIGLIQSTASRLMADLDGCGAEAQRVLRQIVQRAQDQGGKR